MKKKLILSFISTIVIFTTAIPVFAETNTPIITNELVNEYRKDDIRWVYEARDGKLYKRQYNFSRKEWIGDWILCK